MIGLQFPSGPLRILCLGAHPDDVEIGCGGTLLTLAESRDIYSLVVVATGSGIRHEEAIKAPPHFPDFVHCCVQFAKNASRAKT